MIDARSILQATDLAALVGETVPLRKTGAELYGRCPYHPDKSPTLRVNQSKGLWHCPSCQIGGDAISWLRHRDHITFIEAANSLAQRVGLKPGALSGPAPAKAPAQPRYPHQHHGSVPWGGQRLMQLARPVLILHEFPGRRRYLEIAGQFQEHDVIWYPSLWDGFPQWKSSGTPAAKDMYLPPIVGCQIDIPLGCELWQERRSEELLRLVTRWRGYGIAAAARAGRIAS